MSKPRPVKPDPRRLRAVEMAKSGMSMRAIGKAFGVSHEAVRIWLRTEGYASAQIAETKQRMREQKQQRRLEERMQRYTPKDCIVCYQRVSLERLASHGQLIKTCSPDCAKAWYHLRYRTQEGWEKHRLAQAKSILNHPEKHRPRTIEWANKVMDGTVADPRKIWFQKGSKPREYAKRYGWSEDFRERAR